MQEVKVHFRYFRWYSVLILVFLVSCNATKHIKDGELLLRGNSIKVRGATNISQRGIIKDEISGVVKQVPNTYLLGMPYKVYLYNLRYKEYAKNENHFQLRTNFVEAPVLFDSLLMVQSAENIKGYLNNQGFFNPSVTTVLTRKNKKIRASYVIHTGQSLVVNQVGVSCTDTIACRILKASLPKTHLKTFKDYNHFIVGEERIRMVNEMKDWGYYNFGTNNITFELDTTGIIPDYDSPLYIKQHKAKKRGVDIQIQVSDTKDKKAFQVFKIDSVNVYLQYNPIAEATEYTSTTINGITYKYLDEKYLNFSLLDQKIAMRPGQAYSLQAYNQTLKLLNELEVLQIVRIEVTPAADGQPLLQTNIYLNPNEKYDFSTNIEASGGDLYTLGTAVKVSLINKNVFKGANKFTITGSYGLEANMYKNQPDLNFFQQFYLFSQNLGLNFNLTFPKFILPIDQRKFSNNMVPKTFLEGGVNQLNRTDLFSLRSFNAGWGYRWRASTYEQWSIKPVFLNLLNLYDISPAFRLRMDTIPAIKNSYQETFIEGENFEYIYNSELKNPYRYQIIKVGIEESGLLMNGINALYKMANNSADNIKFSEYVRIDFDWRQYLRARKSMWAFRIYGGMGIPYNRAQSLPYIKQYFVGGAYSIRGWRPRVLGPGSFNALENSNASYVFVDQAGDIKFEMNAEYRFPIVALFGGAVTVNGAAFFDAGNIWMMKESPNLPGAEFKLNKFYADLAASYGMGFRFDLGGFLVLRTDFAFQAKKPYEEAYDGWTIQYSRFGNTQWRQENMNFNIAIGYPF